MLERLDQHCEVIGHLHAIAGTGRPGKFKELMTKVEDTSKEARCAMNEYTEHVRKHGC